MTARFERAEQDVRTARARVEEDIETLGREIHDTRTRTKARNGAVAITAAAAAIGLVAGLGGKRALQIFLAAASISGAAVWYAMKKASA